MADVCSLRSCQSGADILPSTVSKNFHDSRVAALVKSGDLQGERKDLLICMECYEKHNKYEWLS